MSTSPDRRPTALIVHAHPERTSFSTAQALVAYRALTERGYTVDQIDLYSSHWNPVLDRNEFPATDGPFKPQRAQRQAVATNTLADDVQQDLTALQRADLLILSFPLWWFSVPAILKGWLDRVLVMGAAFGGDYGLYKEAAMAGRRAVVLATTGGSPASFTDDGDFGDIDAFLFPIHRGVLEFVGYDALSPVVTFGPAHLTDGERTEALEAVHDAFMNLDSRPLASSSRTEEVSAS
ncbi:NAD(P)H-dependent oxidoreductase [Corynebacterium sp.]|uniref:NAD(P)H-dependent oxidoreductase n=1 Tax=Corynebacterium sp. TaxID=1720 RepID=UPI0028A67CD0|nr:NAD(P)H-dependent oxidoreductase [Corynebacterium sp.]